MIAIALVFAAGLAGLSGGLYVMGHWPGFRTEIEEDLALTAVYACVLMGSGAMASATDGLVRLVVSR